MRPCYDAAKHQVCIAVSLGNMCSKLIGSTNLHKHRLSQDMPTSRGVCSHDMGLTMYSKRALRCVTQHLSENVRSSQIQCCTSSPTATAKSLVC